MHIQCLQVDCFIYMYVPSQEYRNGRRNLFERKAAGE